MGGKSKLTLLLELRDRLFNNKLSKTKGKFNKATGSMRDNIKMIKGSTVSAFKAMTSEVPIFGRAMSLLGNPYALVAAGLLATGVLFAKATNKAKVFNHEFLQIQNLNLDKNKSDLKTYKGIILDTAFKTGKSVREMTIGFYDLQSATGIYGNDAAKVLTKIANFSTATGANLNDSINSTTKAMKAFRLGVNDIDNYLASNAKTVQTGIVNFKQLAQVQTEYAGAAAGAGQQIDTANKLFAAFTSISKDARIGATMTKTAFIGLTQASTIKGLKSMGIRMYDINGQMRSLDDILFDVAKKFKKLSPKEVDELINKIGGPEGLRALFTKLKTNAEDLFETFYNFDNSKFNLDKALANARGDATELGNIVKNQWDAILTRLGEHTLPLVIVGLDKINRFLEFIWRNWVNIEATVNAASTMVTTFWSNFIDGGMIAVKGLIGTMKGLADIIQGVITFDWDKVKDGYDDYIKSRQNQVNGVKKAFNYKAVDDAGFAAFNKTYNDFYRREFLKNKDSKNRNLFGNTDGNGDGTGGSSTGSDINSVTSKASQPRSIIVNIDSLNKGGINTQNTTLAHKSPEEIEEWFTESMLRVVRGVELSHG